MDVFDNVLRSVSSGLRYPVIILLVVLAVVVLVLIGIMIAELVSDRRKFKAFMPVLADRIELDSDPVGVIATSGLLIRQKRILVELCKHSELSDESRESMAVQLLEGERARYAARIKLSDYLAKIGPMLGLMGTLIPLGPGLIALGQGDTQTLSESLLTAFDTTVMGMVIAALALLVSTIRKGWYDEYMTMLEACAEIVLKRAQNHYEFKFPEGGAQGLNPSDKPEPVEGAEAAPSEELPEAADEPEAKAEPQSEAASEPEEAASANDEGEER